MKSTNYIRTGDGIHPIGVSDSISFGQEESTQSFSAGARQAHTITFTIEEIVYNNIPYHLKKENRIDYRTTDRQSSYYIPPYFSILGSSRALRKERTVLPTKKVERNVRPKGTHTHCRFYR